MQIKSDCLDGIVLVLGDMVWWYGTIPKVQKNRQLQDIGVFRL